MVSLAKQDNKNTPYKLSLGLDYFEIPLEGTITTIQAAPANVRTKADDPPPEHIVLKVPYFLIGDDNKGSLETLEIKIWIQNFEVTGSALKEKSPGLTHESIQNSSSANIKDADKVNGMSFCQQFLDLNVNEDIVHNMLMSDEAQFHLSGYVNILGKHPSNKGSGMTLREDLTKDLKQTIEQRDRKIGEPERKVDDLEQYQRRQCVRIFGIEEEVGENTDKLVVELATNIGVELKVEDIDRSHRVGRTTRDGRPRTIIVKFCSYRKRSEVFFNKKRLKGSGMTLRKI
ncbi:hypothetical protein ANN_09851 [Periplaneta americana]|uniref:Uncharacterized protein n=1 Tax=Periplaneta americana TaxID=6978 RepID=A0ABQ8TPR0_PERAM|nr:hypothetical protein ANN_09851 [Periplaneta americana]